MECDKLAELIAQAEAAGNTAMADALRSVQAQHCDGATTQGGGTGSGSGGPGGGTDD